MINTLRFISSLTEGQQEVVRETIKKSLEGNDFPESTIDAMTNNAMDGRLSDLEDNIDVDGLIKKLETMNVTGGIKDKRYMDNPDACVECGREEQLNKYNVCKECWENSPAGEHEDWEDTLKRLGRR